MGKGKKHRDQREDIKKRDWERDQGRLQKNIYIYIYTEEINNNKYVYYVYLINIENRGVIMKKIFYH